MKKLLFITFFTLMGVLCFAAPNTAKGGNGNGGKDKIGAYVGWPIGLSYSHEFNDLTELDLLFGYSGYIVWHRVQIQAGALFTVFDPILKGLGNQKCPLSLGPVLGTSLEFLLGELRGSLAILLPLRWEMNFGDKPAFNVFFDFAPLGFSFNFYKEYNPENDTYKTKVAPGYEFRLGVGLRYRIPNKK